jgi:TPR repeat protein
MRRSLSVASLAFMSLTLFCVVPQTALARHPGAHSTSSHYRFHPKSSLAKWLHRRMVTGRGLKFAQLRLLADQGDRLAAFRFATLLEKEPNVPAADIVHYYGIAAALGQKAAVAPLAGILRLHYGEVPSSRLVGAEAALKQAAGFGNAEAMRALAGFYSFGVPFGLKPDDGISLLRAAARVGDLDAAFEIGVILSTGQHTEAELKEARINLDISAKSGNPVARSLASEMEEGQ